MTKTTWGLLLLAAGMGCLSRAPTTYELDRRAGFLGKDAAKDGLAEMRTSSAVARAPRVPVKVPPVIERVWVSDLPLGEDARLQGTWMFLEVEQGRWLDEIDPGGAPLVVEPPKPQPAAQRERAPEAGPRLSSSAPLGAGGGQ